MKQAKQIAASWARSFLAAMITVYIAGVTDPKALVYAFLSAFIAPIWKALDPKAKEFGIGSKK
jgi:hypothetical protein